MQQQTLGNVLLKRALPSVIMWMLLAPAVSAWATDKFEYLPATASTSLNDAMRDGQWISGTGIANFSYDSQPKWIRYSLPPATDIRILSIENPWLRRFDVYLLAGNRVAAQYETGNALPQSARPISSSGFSFGIDLSVTDVYIFDYGMSASYFPLQLRSPTDYASANAGLNAFHGMYYGIVLIMILYNLALFLGTKNSAYVFYSLYAASLMLFLTTADGSGSLFLWPATPGWQTFALAFGWGLAFIFLLEFAQRFLGMGKKPGLGLTQRILQIVVALTVIVIIAAPGNPAFIVQTAVSSILLAALVALGLYASFKRIPNGRIFLAANGIFAIGGFAHVAMLMAWLEPSEVLQHAVHIGSIGELVLLSVGLVRTLRDSSDARYAAFQQSQELTRRNKELRTAKALAEEHRQLQKSLQQAQKLKTIGQLAGGFAHDFNNILASILGFAELARDKSSAADRPTLLRYLEEIQNSGERGANLVKQLLVYSRSTSSEPKELNLGDTLQQAQDLLRGSLPATISINTYLPAQSVHMLIDPEQLQQMLVNLCINAAEAMNNRGQIDIRLEQEDLDSLSCTSCLTRFSGHYIAIKIEDSGGGIIGSAEQLFTPFHTSKEVGQGTGLGLSVVHGIVHEHGGHIHAGNRAEGGARFVIYLPPQPVALGAPATSKRILLIEDDPSVALYLKSLLDDDVYETTFTSMPTEALETFVANPDAFDLVITDYLMPQGTGLELAEDIHALRPDLPVLLTTGNANNLDKNDLANASITAVFEKPLNSEQLLAKIRGILAN